MHRKTLVGITAVIVTFGAASPAQAWDCIVAKKPATAGAVGVDSDGSFTPLKNNPGTPDKPHGAFIAIGEGDDATSVYIRGMLPPVTEGGSQHDCDGKGLDSGEVCFGSHH